MPKTRAAAFDSFQSASEFAFHSTATRATTGMHSFRSSCGQARDASGRLLLPDNQAARASPSGAKSLSGRTRTGVSSVSVSRTPPQAAQANECTMTAHEARCSNFDMYHFISILQLAQVGGSRPASESLRRSTIAPSFFQRSTSGPRPTSHFGKLPQRPTKHVFSVTTFDKRKPNARGWLMPPRLAAWDKKAPLPRGFS